MNNTSDLEDPQLVFIGLCKKERWDLLLGVCAIAAEEDKSQSIPDLQNQIRSIAQEIHIPESSDPFQQTARLSYCLFHQKGFSGDTTEYDAPKNSLVSHTLKYKTGLPITLSVLTLCVAKLLNISLEGVNTPGHFLLRKPDSTPPFFIDPFHQGRIIRDEELKSQLESRHGKIDQKGWSEATQTASIRDIFIRINNNLLISYRQRDDFAGVLRALERLKHLIPENPQLIRAYVQILSKQGKYHEAAKELELYIERFPNIQDIDSALQELAILKGIN
jgi:regulator of sirC expression with transglutaminase-like and TPR domain